MIEEIKDKLADRNLAKVSEETGVSYGTVYKIAKGKNDNPSYKTVIALSNYLGISEGANEVKA